MNYFGKWMALTVIALCGISCDSNDGPSPSESVVGTYEGYTLSSCAYFSDTCAGDEKIVITGNADGTVDLAFESSTWGRFSIEKATVTETKGGYAIAGSGHTEMGMQTVNSYDCTVAGTIRSTSEATLTFDVPSVMGGLKVVFTTGEAPAEQLLPGTYEGYTSASSAYFQNMYTDDEALTIAASGTTLSLRFESSMGTFEVASLEASLQDGLYTVEGSGNVAMGMGASTNSYPFTLTGRVNAAKNDYEFTATVPSVMGGLTIKLLPGTAPTE